MFDHVALWIKHAHCGWLCFITVCAAIAVSKKVESISNVSVDGFAANRTVMKLLASACNDVVPYGMRNPVDSSKQRAVTC